MKPVKPHVSEALRHLRGGITGAAIIVALCATVQLLVFGFVHFTQIRWEQPASTTTSQTPTVVMPSDRSTAAPSAATGKGSSILIAQDSPASAGEKATHAPKPVAMTAPGAPRPGMLLSRWHGTLGFCSDAAVTVGMIAAVFLTLLAFQGVMVGSQVPGIEKAVSASTWSLVLMLISIPWREVFPKIPFGGVFGSYEAMTKASAACQLGLIPDLALMAEYLLLPLMTLVSGMFILIRFRTGVEHGCIVTSVNELDAALEREMRDIAKRGPAPVSVARSVGALNQAIGERPSDPIMDSLLSPAKPGKAHPHEPDVSRTRTRATPIERPSDESDDGPRRPI
jgi:hypothetical protein